MALSTFATCELEPGGDPRDGYLYLPRLLPRATVLGLRREILTWVAERGWLDPDAAPLDGVSRAGLRLGAHDAAYLELAAMTLALPAFAALGEHPAVLGAVAEALGGVPLGRLGGVVRLFSPRTDDLTTAPHQEHHYVGGSADAWSAWIPLGDCPRSLGGLAVLRGSAAAGLRPHGPGASGAVVAERGAWATTDYGAGDVLLVHCLTLHRALPNRSADRVRLSVDFRYSA